MTSLALWVNLFSSLKQSTPRAGVTANLAIALHPPPVGGTLFVAANLAKGGISQIIRHLIPLMGATVDMLFLITYFPGLTRVMLWLLARWKSHDGLA